MVEEGLDQQGVPADSALAVGSAWPPAAPGGAWEWLGVGRWPWGPGYPQGCGLRGCLGVGSLAVLRPRVRPGGVEEETLWKEVFPSRFVVAVPARCLPPM